MGDCLQTDKQSRVSSAAKMMKCWLGWHHAFVSTAELRAGSSFNSNQRFSRRLLRSACSASL